MLLYICYIAYILVICIWYLREQRYKYIYKKIIYTIINKKISIKI